jgi:hypothetical protein
MAEKPNSKFRSAPSLSEDVGKNTVRDLKQFGKSATNGSRGAAADASLEAGTRAASRLVGRAGAAGAALSAGWEAGRAIDRATGVGRKIVDSVMGPAKADGDRVTLSKREESTPEYGNEGRRTKGADQPRRVGTTGEWKDTSGVREGSNSNIDDGVRARARRYTDEN